MSEIDEYNTSKNCAIFWNCLDNKRLIKIYDTGSARKDPVDVIDVKISTGHNDFIFNMYKNSNHKLIFSKKTINQDNDLNKSVVKFKVLLN